MLRRFLFLNILALHFYVSSSQTYNLVKIQDGAETPAGDPKSPAKFKITVEPAQLSDVFVPWSTGDVAAANGATAGTDYEPSASTASVRIGAGESESGEIPVEINEDFDVEGEEVFTVTISPSSGTAQTGSLTFTIADDDFKLNVEKVSDGFEEGPDAQVKIVRTGLAVDVLVSYATFNRFGSDTAVSPDDFVDIPLNTMLTIPAAMSEATVNITINDDDFVEDPPEEFTFAIITGNQNSLRVGDNGTVKIVIFDEDFSFSFERLREATEGGDAAQFQISRTGGTGGTMTVTYSITGDTATAGDDFSGVDNGVIVFQPGESTKNINITAVNDDVPEGDEVLLVTVHSVVPEPVGGFLETTKTATITDNDIGYTIVAAAEEFVEGRDVAALFNVTRLGDTSLETAVDYHTVEGSAMNDTDFTPTNVETIVFTPGDTLQQVAVPIANDDTLENAETFMVKLFNPSSGSSVVTDSATATIIDDDFTVIAEKIQDGEETVSGDPPIPAQFKFVRSGSTAVEATIEFSPVDVDADNGDDYDLDANNVATIPAGETESDPINITILDDTEVEGLETFNVSFVVALRLMPSFERFTLGIIDNEFTVSLEKLSDGVEEGTDAQIKVVRTGAVTADAIVSYITDSDTAEFDVDYNGTSNGLVTIPAGQTEATINITMIDDNEIEDPAEIFLVVIGSVQPSTGAVTDPSEVTVTILDNDPEVNVTLVTDGAEGGDPVTFELSRKGGTAGIATVTYNVVGVTATAGIDFPVIENAEITFQPNETVKTIEVPVEDDEEVETDEELTIELLSITVGTLGKPKSATGQILENDVGFAVVSVETQYVEAEGATAVFNITREGSLTNNATCAYTTADGTAVAGDDYTLDASTLTFAAGDNTPITVSIELVNDDTIENDEEFTLELQCQIGGIILPNSTATANIIDDDFILNVEKVRDGEEKLPTPAQFKVTRTGSTIAEVIIQYTTTALQGDGAATSDDDFEPVSENDRLTVSIPAGETESAIVNITVKDDSEQEGDEFFNVTIGSGTGILGTATVTFGIIDDEFSVSLEKVNDGVEEGTDAQFKVVRTGATIDDAIVTYSTSTSPGTASAGDDYIDVSSANVTIASGEREATINITILDDDEIEDPSETFDLDLIGVHPASGSVTTSSFVTSTILDNDSEVNITLVTDGAEGGKPITFQVTRRGGTVGTATVTYNVVGNTATAGIDFPVAENAEITFQPNETVKTIEVPVTDDEEVETDEELTVELVSNTAVKVGSPSSASGQILENDVGFSIATTRNGAEGATQDGIVNVVCTVTRSGSFTEEATVTYSTVDGTAKAGTDYTADGTPFTFAAGDTNPKVITIAVIDDNVVEDTEAFQVDLTASSGTILTKSASATIADDDIAFEIAKSQDGLEGKANATFSVRRTGVTSVTSTVIYSTVNGSATAESDFTGAIDAKVVFDVGDIDEVITIPILDDGSIEGDESFQVTLTSADRGEIISATATATIKDDDFIFDVVKVQDGVEGGVDAVFQLTRKGTLTESSTVSISIGSGDATAGSDFKGLNSSSVVFGATEASKNVSISITDDEEAEGEESFDLILTSAIPGGLGTTSATATIFDNDYIVDIAKVQDGGEGGADPIFTVTRRGGLSFASTILYSTTGGNATAGTDYNGATSTEIVFGGGEASKDVTIAVVDDDVAEGIETFDVVVQASLPGVLDTSSITVTIVDNDFVFDISKTQDPVEGGVNAKFTVTRSGDLTQTTTVDYCTKDGTATSGSDYIPASGRLTFRPGETEKCIEVGVVDDSGVEVGENFEVELKSPSAGGRIGTGSANATITSGDTHFPTSAPTFAPTTTPTSAPTTTPSSARAPVTDNTNSTNQTLAPAAAPGGNPSNSTAAPAATPNGDPSNATAAPAAGSNNDPSPPSFTPTARPTNSPTSSPSGSPIQLSRPDIEEVGGTDLTLSFAGGSARPMTPLEVAGIEIQICAQVRAANVAVLSCVAVVTNQVVTFVSVTGVLEVTYDIDLVVNTTAFGNDGANSGDDANDSNNNPETFSGFVGDVFGGTSVDGVENVQNAQDFLQDLQGFDATSTYFSEVEEIVAVNKPVISVAPTSAPRTKVTTTEKKKKKKKTCADSDRKVAFFFPKDNQTRTCNWLSKRSNGVQKWYCRNARAKTGRPVSRICPETCGTCIKKSSCADKKSEFISYKKRRLTCAYLDGTKKDQIRRAVHCLPGSQPEKRCKKSCDNCDFAKK